MTKRKKTRNKIKEKAEEPAKELNDVEWTEYPSLQRGCRVTVENIKVDRGPDQDVVVSRRPEVNPDVSRRPEVNLKISTKLELTPDPELTDRAGLGKRKHAKDYYADLLKDKLQKKNEMESAKKAKQVNKKPALPKKSNILRKRETKKKAAKQEAVAKVDAESGTKDDYIFIDFELSKSRRISEINTLIRGAGGTNQISSLPPK